MIRRVTFDSSDRDATRFTILWDGLRFGVQMIDPKKRDRDMMRKEASLRRKLKAISVSMPLRNADDKDEDRRRLQDVGGSVELSQPELKRLIDHGWGVMWPSAQVEDAEDGLDFADAAEEVKDTSSDDTSSS